ncbi:hypothetical protein CRYUN_Cryun17cG0095600 [Craigia yunnanensis]
MMLSITSMFVALILHSLLSGTLIFMMYSRIGLVVANPRSDGYFKEHGLPSSTIFETPPEGDEERAKLIDALQDWKMERYKEIIKSGTVEPRPGVLRLMDEAKAAGKKLAVCSAATKSSVALCLENLIGMERFQGIDCFLASDDVKEKKPDPLIYVTTAKRLGVPEKDCLVVEDSVLGGRRSTSSEFGLIVGENCNLSSTFHQK